LFNIVSRRRRRRRRRKRVMVIVVVRLLEIARRTKEAKA